jgi:hypothetical protein
VWFGLDGNGIEKSVDFHKVLGPLLMIAFAFLGNTVFLTLLVAMLSHHRSTIVANATIENQYRRAVVTFGGVKSDSIFAYQPPFNILAVCLLLPLKFMVSPRWFHKINVAAIRSLNAPLLLIICLYERKYLWRDSQRKDFGPRGRHGRGFWGLPKLSVYGGVRAVFNHEPSESSLYDSLYIKKCTVNIADRFPVTRENYQNNSYRSTQQRRKSRRPSYVSPFGLMDHANSVSHALETRKELK